MRSIVAGVLVVAVAAGCGGSTSVVPAAVADADELIVSGFADVLVAFASFRKLELLLTDPEGAEAAGIVFEPDPEGPANQFLSEFPYEYQSGPLAGSTGVCGGTAFFLPP